MKILHVTLGNPIDHQGGLSRYCIELMQYQSSQGNDVQLLYPSSIGKFTKNVTIKKDADGYWNIVGSLPMAITYGIDNPKRYMRKVDKQGYYNWVSQLKPDIVHVHSIQGVHLEFFQVLSELHIPSIYTTHDFYPICVRGFLLNSHGLVCDGPNNQKCARCNYNAGLSPMVQIIRQSPMYCKVSNLLKKTKQFSKYVNNRGSSIYSTNSDGFDEISISDEIQQSFRELLAYNHKIMREISLLHCNSPATQSIYLKYYPDLASCCIPVVHEGLVRTKHKCGHLLRFSYFGGTGKHKGYDLFLEVLKLFKNCSKTNWEAYLYGGNFNEGLDDDRIHYMNYFTKNQEEEVWERTDVLIVPSLCYETYGFSVIEALCHGIPVVASDSVGSSYILSSIDYHLVFQSGNVKALFESMEYIMNRENYTRISRSIQGINLPISLPEHAEEIQKIYFKIIGENL